MQKSKEVPIKPVVLQEDINVKQIILNQISTAIGNYISPYRSLIYKIHAAIK
jgi:hypothetical protein